MLIILHSILGVEFRSFVEAVYNKVEECIVERA